jgi:hypothetical protein
MDVKIDIDPSLWDKAKEKLSSRQIAAAMRMAINEGLVKGRTEVRRGIQQVYNIRTGILNDEKTGLKLKKATGTNLTGDISANHKPMSISDADPKFKGVTVGQQFTRGKDGKVKKGAKIRRSVAQISVEVIKGQRKPINSAFAPGRATNSQSGKQHFTTAIFARGKRGKPGFNFGKARLPIDSISTVSPGTAATNERSVEQYSEIINNYAKGRFIHHINRLIAEVDGLSS